MQDTAAMQNQKERAADVPEQARASWGLALVVSWGSLRRRLLRSLITMLGIILAVAFLTYMLVTNDITDVLVKVDNDNLNVLLQKAGVDIFEVGKTDRMMMLLIGLSLFTCLVGIINSMLMAVTERISEIGTLKCLGALDEFIIKTYLIESSVQGIFGTIVGMTVGLTVALGVSLKSYGGYVFSNLPVLDILKTMSVAFIIGGIISVTASILPAYWAAKKEPVEAMRVEE